MKVNANFAQRAAVRGSTNFVASPMPGVERLMLDRVGDEVARATSIVRYAPGSRFAPHVHSGGEEFLVLDGVFEDEAGRFPTGIYVRNPIGTSHAPASPEGCTIFVKLWQFSPDEHHVQRTDTAQLNLEPLAHRPGVAAADLFQDAREQVSVEAWTPGAAIALQSPGGLEVLVLDGEFVHDGEVFKPHNWLRLPDGDRLTVCAGSEGARVWTKTGHLRHLDAATLEQVGRA